MEGTDRQTDMVNRYYRSTLGRTLMNPVLDQQYVPAGGAYPANLDFYNLIRSQAASQSPGNRSFRTFFPVVASTVGTGLDPRRVLLSDLFGLSQGGEGGQGPKGGAGRGRSMPAGGGFLGGRQVGGGKRAF